MFLFLSPHAVYLLYNRVGFLTLKGDFYTCLPLTETVVQGGAATEREPRQEKE